MHAPTSLTEAQEALKRAQEERARVMGMRPKTEEIAGKARRLLAENHLAWRFRETYR